MQYKDYYKILGVARDADADQIKAAYRKLARKYHPDVSKEADAEARFKEVNEAYEVLRDAEKRSAYDRLGSDWRAGQEFRPPPGWEGRFNQGGDAAGFSDFFESLFGDFGLGGGRGGPQFGQRGAPGTDQQAKVTVSLEEAFQGTTREISLRAPAVGPGGGISQEPRVLRVKIPAGVQSGQQIRLQGQGGRGLGGGRAGDLYLEVEIAPHPLFRLEGRDVYLDLPIAPWEAALGAKLEAPTLGGPVGLSVPAGSQSGRKLRLKGRGLAGPPPGDQYIVLKMVTPPADTPELNELYAQLRDKSRFDPRGGFGG